MKKRPALIRHETDIMITTHEGEACLNLGIAENSAAYALFVRNDLDMSGRLGASFLRHSSLTDPHECYDLVTPTCVQLLSPEKTLIRVFIGLHPNGEPFGLAVRHIQKLNRLAMEDNNALGLLVEEENEERLKQALAQVKASRESESV